jgi:[CysO sulfur-carrier protein]-thiocarboxylate-dependent cysteine synthase
VHRVITPSLLDLVGETPLVELSRLTPRASVRMYAKLEGQNPTGSIKDRVAKSMIDAAEGSGELEPGRHLLEPTSGNTGISLALIAKLKGYPLTCVMPENATEERKRLLRLYGSEIILSPAAEGSNGAVRTALELAEADPRYFMPFQYGNEANPLAHYEGTGAEIVADLPQVTHFVAGMGTGGTLTGVGRRLHEHDPGISVVAAEPELDDLVYGLRSLDAGFIPPIFDPEVVNRKFLVDSSSSLRTNRELTANEGIFAGISSGAVVYVARRIAQEIEEGDIVCLLPDGGWKYLSTEAWSPDLHTAEKGVAESLWW